MTRGHSPQGSPRRCARGDGYRSVQLFLVGLVVLSCSRSDHRQAADDEVRQLVAEKSNDARWALKEFSIEMDPRSRYYDPGDPDHPSMPQDDPASHEFMVRVDGKRGYAGWTERAATEEDHRTGGAHRLENPDWRRHLGEDLPQTGDGKVSLKLADALRLALIHSPSYHQQLESIYLSALDVSTERFRFDTQFFGGFTASAAHRGSDNPGGESTTLALEPNASIRKRFAAAGELLVSFANSIGWEFFGPNDGFASSQLGFSLVQPLLRRGGRAVALEQLTIAERTLLANLRAFQLYRQGFYTLVAIGELGVSGPQRRGGFFGGTGLTGFTGQGSGGFGGVGDITGFGRGGGGFGGGGGGGGAGFAGGGAGSVGGFIGLQQQAQQIRNTRDSLEAQLRTLALLESNLEAGLIDIAQVDQFRQNIETERANLLQAQNGLLSSLDSFNLSVLGLPPDLPIEPDDAFIRPFQLIAPAVTAVQNSVAQLIDALGELPETPAIGDLRRIIGRIEPLRMDISTQIDLLPADFARLHAASDVRTRAMTPSERRLFDRDVEQLHESLRDLRQRFSATAARREQLEAALTPESIDETADGVIELLTELSNVVGELSLVQARARLESITLVPIEFDAAEALEIARDSRLDWMNNRAALVDTWRLIEFNANALQSDLSLRFSGEVRTAGDDNPVKFRDDTGSVRAALEFDGPFARLVERNNFRQQLIQYQQDRRQLIRFEDSVHQTLRRRLRDLEELRLNLEIQRRAVAIAIRRVDQTREALYRPVPPSAPGEAPQALGPTAAQNLLFALSDLRNTQNNLMSVWLNHLAERMRLHRDIGVMQLDERGIWIDQPLAATVDQVVRREPLPPAIPDEWLSMNETDREGSNSNVPSTWPHRPERHREHAGRKPQ